MKSSDTGGVQGGDDLSGFGIQDSCECETTPSGETSKATVTLEGILLTMAFPPSGRVTASTSPMFIFPARMRRPWP